YLDFGEDTAELANDIRNAVNQITVFPADAEEPVISELESEEVVARVVISGNRDPIELKRYADEFRTNVLANPSTSRAQMVGVADYLIGIEVPSARLEALGLSLDDLARRIQARSLELSGGELEDTERRLLVRTLGKAEAGDEFGDIVILTSEDDAPVLLEDIAKIDDGLAESPLYARLDGEPAVGINIYRIGDERVFDVLEDVKALIAESGTFLPPDVHVNLYQDRSIELTNRVNLLVSNAAIGFLLILVLLLLFLDVRVAFWVGVGVALSFVGTFLPMAMAGVAISQMSLFGFILAIGIVVDDAIVVGENIYATVEDGEEDTRQAAKRGTIRVATPVFFSVSTTVAAFLPLMFVPSTVGQFIGDIAFVVVAVLILSLIESFFILPQHLSHLHDRPPGRISIRRFTDPLRNTVAKRLDAFSEKSLGPAVRFSAERPLVTVMFSAAALIGTFTLFNAGFIRSTFFPEIEGNYVMAELQLAEAASEHQTAAAVSTMLDGAETAAETLSERTGTDTDIIIENILWNLGSSIMGPQPGDTDPSGSAAANRAFVEVKIEDASTRKFSATEFEDIWREATGRIPGAQKLTFSSNLVGGGLPVQFEVASTDEADARAVVALLRSQLETIPGVFDVSDDRFRTTPEVQIRLRPEAASYGVDLSTVARAVRSSYFGAEAVRIQRDREEIEVRLRLPQDERQSIADIKRQKIIIGDVAIPIAQIADISVGQAPASITRIDRQRVFRLQSDVDFGQITGGEATAKVLNDYWPTIAAEHPNVTVSPGGDQEEQARTRPVLTRNFILALFSIYALLALAFRSYTQPLIVLSVIPFGLIGALWGHALLGLEISLLSIFGIIGLSGVIINDALLMVDYINENLAKGMRIVDGITDAAVKRFRPIILTSLTTFFGVTPIVLEQSVQAAFLKPTAVSLGFGILFGTVVLMVVVPAMTMLHIRGRKFTQRFRREGFGAFSNTPQAQVPSAG
ncbi:MAG: efflux RND transporter permease subunit, partial [Parvularculaceae bacterium]|nr:efflux RND transporter permease subunit [Parvularculaceae bacterium]